MEANLINHINDHINHKTPENINPNIRDWRKYKAMEKDYIIGVDNGIAKIKLPNTPENRMHIASLGYDILSTNKIDANQLWQANVAIEVKKVESGTIANQIKQIN